jgi:pimeloyl-ACP methyl ester carboxylesterase
MPGFGEVLRTPEDRFAGLPDWPYAPIYIDDLPSFPGLRLAAFDEGPKDAAVTFVCLHGDPTWSYLYRRMIPVFVGAGHRVVGWDWFGFGRSDKPADEAVYTWDFHRRTMLEAFDRFELQNVCLVVQDWGGLLGLTLPVDRPTAITRLLIMNTGLGVGRPPSAAWLAWRDYNRANPDLPVGRVMARATPHLTPAEVAAYDAPFPDARYKAGVRRFPEMVPITPEMDGVADSKRALGFFGAEWSGETYIAIGADDPVLPPEILETLATRIRGCGAPERWPGVGHFVQEWGEPVARAALARFGLG